MYRLTKFDQIERLIDGTVIPRDPDNRDFQLYLQWVAEGNSPEEVPGPTIDEQKRVINTQRDVDLQQGVTFNGRLYHSDDAFRADLTDMIMAYDKGIFPANSVQNIRTKDNEIVQLGVQQLILLKLTIGQMRQGVFATSWAAKDALDNPPQEEV